MLHLCWIGGFLRVGVVASGIFGISTELHQFFLVLLLIGTYIAIIEAGHWCAFWRIQRSPVQACVFVHVPLLGRTTPWHSRWINITFCLAFSLFMKLCFILVRPWFSIPQHKKCKEWVILATVQLSWQFSDTNNWKRYIPRLMSVSVLGSRLW